MRLHRFFIPQKVGDQHSLMVANADLLHQLRHVFRLKKGDSIIIFDESGFDHECTIIEINDESVNLNISSAQKSRYMPDRKIYVCAAVIKKDNFETIVEKATELGVTDIIPILAERSEKKALNEERLIQISIEASEQSGRGDVPTIHEISSLGNAIDVVGKTNNQTPIINNQENHKSKNLKLGNGQIQMVAFHTEGELIKNSELESLHNESIAVFVGPEGGWSEKEIEVFHRNNVRIVCLGKQILRAETAAIVALSKVVL